MTLHLGSGFTADIKNIISVMDIEKASTSRITREYLAEAGKAGRVVFCTLDLPKSFVVSLDENLTERVYICGVSAETLKKRINDVTRGIFE